MGLIKKMKNQYIIKYKKKYYSPDYTNSCNFFKSENLQEATVFLIDENDFYEWTDLITNMLMSDIHGIQDKSDILFLPVYIN